MKIHIIQHEAFEGLGAIQTWVDNNGYQVDYTRLYNGDRIFDGDLDFDFLLIMGGPQSPRTTMEQCPYFDSAAEISFIQRAIADNKIMVGVCLGAQMIGEAFGAQYERSPQQEIGIFPVTLTDAGKKDSIFSKFPATFMAGHWHNDMPGLPKGATILAESAGCPRQIVRFNETAYGLQCHLEFNREAVEGLLSNCEQDLHNKKPKPFTAKPTDLRAYDYDDMNQLLFHFLDTMAKKAYA